MPSYLVTGASKGLGLEFVRQLVAKDSNIVIATSRGSSSSLQDLQKEHKNLHLIQVDIADMSAVQSRLASEVSKILGSSDARLDFLLNSAGIKFDDQDVMHVQPDNLSEHMRVNVQGPTETVKALTPNLQSGSVVMNMTSGVGSIHRMKNDKFGVGVSYAVSKAALNMLSVMQANHFQSKGVTVIVMDPGHVQTDMGGSHAPLTPKESIGGMLKVLGGLKAEDTAKFYQYDGAEVLW